VWPGEREALAVWADELQARGDRLGELIATNLRAEQVAAEHGLEHAAELARAAEAIRLDSIEDLLGPAIGELPRLRLRWQLGVVRGLYLDGTHGPHPSPQLVLEVVAKLLRRPVLRFLDDLYLEAVLTREPGIERELLHELSSREVVARPRRIVVGSMPRRFRQPRGIPEGLRLVSRGFPQPEQFESALARGLTWYGAWGRVTTMPWARGDHGTRLQKLEQMLARPWTDSLAAPIAASIWDTSLAIRRRTLEALPSLPDALAPALRSVLAIDLHGEAVFGDLALRCATRIAAERPNWVASVAETFGLHEPWVALWLSELRRPEARRAIPRIHAMYRRLSTSGDDHVHRIQVLARALQGFGEPRQPEIEHLSDDETIAELLAKLGKHRGL
jgi:hypothetical protein